MQFLQEQVFLDDPVQSLWQSMELQLLSALSTDREIVVSIKQSKNGHVIS